MKKKIAALVIASALCVVALGGCGNSEFDEAYQDAQEQMEDEAARLQEEMENAAETETPEPEAETPEPESETAAPESGTDQESETADADAPVGSGTYEVDGIRITYYADVRNDTTGNWRLAVIYDGSDLKDYVSDFYQFFIRDDAEVFGIVNLGTETTARVDRVMGSNLDVTVMEYVDGEEHDAKVLFSGNELERYWIDMETGEVDPVEEDE